MKGLDGEGNERRWQGTPKDPSKPVKRNKKNIWTGQKTSDKNLDWQGRDGEGPSLGQILALGETRQM